MSRPLGQAEKQYISQGSDELDFCSDELVLCADVMALVLLNLTPLKCGMGHCADNLTLGADELAPGSEELSPGSKKMAPRSDDVAFGASSCSRVKWPLQ